MWSGGVHKHFAITVCVCVCGGGGGGEKRGFMTG